MGGDEDGKHKRHRAWFWRKMNIRRGASSPHAFANAL
jgi:hypothetical protein